MNAKLLNQIIFFPVAVLHVMDWLLKTGLLHAFFLLTFLIQISLRVGYCLLIFLALFFALLVWGKMSLFHLPVSVLEWWAFVRFEVHLALWLLCGLVLDASILVAQTAFAYWVYGIGKA